VRLLRLALLLLLFSAESGGAEPLLWGGLKAGPYAVGYRTSWTTDATRQFDAKLPDGSQYASGKTPRPILVNEWYPAESRGTRPPMKQGDYLKLAGATGRLHLLSEALIEFSRGVNMQDLVDAEDPKHPTPAQQAALDRYYAAPTAAVRDAPARPGKFPVAIYVHGYGSSFEDNTVLAEYLASHGFVVITSAYQDGDLRMIADLQETGDDVQFLIHYAGSRGCCSGQKVALIGHSGGAQSILAYQSKPGAMADALVSLDSTEDYRYTNSFLFKDFVSLVHPSNLTVPILFAADPQASFQLADAMKRSHRYFLTERNAEHEEFIAEGVARTILLDTRERSAVEEKYTALCENILGFLSTALQLDLGGKPSWPQSTEPDFERNVVNLEDAPAGSSVPVYSEGDIPPTPRQFRDLLVAGKYDLAAASLDKFSGNKEWTAISLKSAFMVVDYLLADDRPGAARQLNDAYRRADSRVHLDAQYIAWGDRYLALRGRKESKLMYQRALILDPGSIKASEGLKKSELLPPQ
jgi:pimeloyl-ACP methyl ester carboxylesterase